MKIVDMKRDDYPEPNEYEDNPYPCSLRISLNEKDMAKLGIDKMPELGEQVCFYVCGEVVSTHESSEYGESKCMGVQIQQMALEEPPEEEQQEEKDAKNMDFKGAASKLYGGKK